MATTLKLDIIFEKIKVGRKIIGYNARYNSLEARGNTKAEALTALKQKLSDRTDWCRSRVKIEKLRGYVGVFYHQLSGTVESRTVLPLQADGTINSSTIGYSSIEDAVRSFRSNVAQLTWDGESLTSDIIEDADEQDQFSYWAKWQLAYRHAKGRGANDIEARAYANGGGRHLEEPAVA